MLTSNLVEGHSLHYVALEVLLRPTNQVTLLSLPANEANCLAVNAHESDSWTAWKKSDLCALSRALGDLSR